MKTKNVKNQSYIGTANRQLGHTYNIVVRLL